MTRRPGRRTGTALVTAGVACLACAALGGATATSAHAEIAPGSGFGALDLTALSASIRLPMYSHQSEDVSFSVPYAQSTLGVGGVGHAVSAALWPGATGANGGKVLALLGAQCVPPNPQGLIPVVPCATTAPQPPSQVYQALNDPEKAETTTSSGKDTVTLDRPYGDMSATATASKVAATTTMAGGKTIPAAVTFGQSLSSTSAVLTGAQTAVVDAMSSVRKVSIGGVITIGTLTSLAHVTTDGVKATGTAHTDVSDMRVAGVPVTVDEHGISVAGHRESPGQATDALNRALAQTGFKIVFSQPRKDVKAGQATLDAGGLVVEQNNSQYTTNGNDTGQMIVLGGASVIAGASPGFPYTPVPIPAAAVPGSGGGASGAASMPGGSGGAPVIAGGGPGSAPEVAGAGSSSAPMLAGNGLPLPTGTSALLVALAVLGAGLIATGLRRFTDKVLVAGGPACPLGDK